MSAANRDPWILEHLPYDVIAHKRLLAMRQAREVLLDAANVLASLDAPIGRGRRQLDEAEAMVREAAAQLRAYDFE